jgi:hypothetical protein
VATAEAVDPIAWIQPVEPRNRAKYRQPSLRPTIAYCVSRLAGWHLEPRPACCLAQACPGPCLPPPTTDLPPARLWQHRGQQRQPAALLAKQPGQSALPGGCSARHPDRPRLPPPCADIQPGEVMMDPFCGVSPLAPSPPLPSPAPFPLPPHPHLHTSARLHTNAATATMQLFHWRRQQRRQQRERGGCAAE